MDTLIEYVTKREDNRKEAEKMKRDLEAMGHERKAAHIMATAADHREVTQSEAYFRIDPSLEMAKTNLRTTFLNTRFPEMRSRRYQRRGQDDDNMSGEETQSEVENEIDDETEEEPSVVEGFQIEGKEGTYHPQETMIDKYKMLPDKLRLLVLIQFVMNYVLASIPQSASLRKKYKSQDEIPDSNVLLAMSNDNKEKEGEKYLPSKILLTNGKFMTKTKKPTIVKLKMFKEAHEKEYSDLLLYRPWSSEENDLGDALADMGVCSAMHARMDRVPELRPDGEFLTKIETVKSRLNR